MRLSTMQSRFVWLLSLFFAVAAAQSYSYGVDIDILTRRQDNGRIVIKPLPQTRNGTVPLRPEIREMQADRYKWDLYILSMSMLMDVNQDDPASWYQIAGIHGVPFEAWNGVEAAPGANQSGYCTHNSVLFPMWHRPYLTLFEQELYRMANLIAGMFPNGTDRQSYIDAARDFRMPYWNWAMPAPEGESHFPDVFWNKTIAQNGPRGVQDIHNPLYSYQFHPKNATAMIWTPLRNWNETKRAPNSTEASNQEPTSDNEQVNRALLSKLPEIQRRLSTLFSSYKDFNSFGSKAWAFSNNSTLDSLESVHDIIHIFGGLQGHMTFVPLSSFDPLFLLHHTMTDRLVAIWQAMNPDSWLTPLPAGENSFTSIKGEMQDSQSPLTPFLSSEDGTFWNSDTARTTEAFGYAYADTDLTGRKKEDVRQELQKKITDWWGGNSVSLLASTKYPAATEWVADVRLNVLHDHAFTFIHFFLGDPPGGQQSWLSAQNNVGSVLVSSGPNTTAVVGVHLTPEMMRRVQAREMVEKLQFRIVENGNLVHPDDVDLRIQLAGDDGTLIKLWG